MNYTFEILLILGVVILGYTTLNLLLKVEKMEDMIKSQDNFRKELDIILKTSSQRLEEIDVKGVFSSDDEIGWFFNEIKLLQQKLSNFIKTI
jgi:hypothetical protein